MTPKKQKYHVIVEWHDMKHKKHYKTVAVFDTVPDAEKYARENINRGVKYAIAKL